MEFAWFWYGSGMVLVWFWYGFTWKWYGFGMEMVGQGYGNGMTRVWKWYDNGMPLAGPWLAPAGTCMAMARCALFAGTALAFCLHWALCVAGQSGHLTNLALIILQLWPSYKSGQEGGAG